MKEWCLITGWKEPALQQMKTIHVTSCVSFSQNGSRITLHQLRNKRQSLNVWICVTDLRQTPSDETKHLKSKLHCLVTHLHHVWCCKSWVLVFYFINYELSTMQSNTICMLCFYVMQSGTFCGHIFLAYHFVASTSSAYIILTSCDSIACWQWMFVVLS